MTCPVTAVYVLCDCPVLMEGWPSSSKRQGPATLCLKVTQSGHERVFVNPSRISHGF